MPLGVLRIIQLYSNWINFGYCCAFWNPALVNSLTILLTNVVVLTQGFFSFVSIFECSEFL